MKIRALYVIIWHYKRAYYESTLSLQGLSSTQIFARPRTSCWHCIPNLWQWLSQIFRKKNVYVIFYQTALMNFQRVTEEGIFFACLKITTHKLQRALVATSFNNWAAISFTQLWHIGVKSFLKLVSYNLIQFRFRHRGQTGKTKSVFLKLHKSRLS